jgi:polyphosphate glucokinase
VAIVGGCVNVLAVDIGGAHVKFRTQRHTELVKVKSGKKMTPEKMMASIKKNTHDWKYDCISLGYPGPVIHDSPLAEPFNLGKGWVKFDYKKAFGNKPLRMLNDAAMQALGSYKHGRMLFLGLGTGLGAALVVDGVVQAVELAHLPWKKGKTYEDFLGEAALKHDGRKKWRKNVLGVIAELNQMLQSDYVVLGGGNAKLTKNLPNKVVLGTNDNAFKGAFRIWKKEHHASR